MLETHTHIITIIIIIALAKQIRFECETKRKQIKFHRKPNDFSTSVSHTVVAPQHQQHSSAVQKQTKMRKTIAFVIIAFNFFLFVFFAILQCLSPCLPVTAFHQ